MVMPCYSISNFVCQHFHSWFSFWWDGELRGVFEAMSRRQLISEKRRLEKAEVVTRSMMLKTWSSRVVCNAWKNSWLGSSQILSLSLKVVVCLCLCERIFSLMLDQELMRKSQNFSSNRPWWSLRQIFRPHQMSGWRIADLLVKLTWNA